MRSNLPDYTYSRDLLIAELKRDEGWKNKPYVDSVGKVSIGVGRNLTDRGVSDGEISDMLQNDISDAALQLCLHLPWWETLDDVRQRVLLNLCFNVGIGTLLTFAPTLALIQSGNYSEAARHMRASLWAKQVGQRAERLATAMETGVMPT